MKFYYGAKNKKNYFEGWYFKHSSSNLNIAFIPSISVVDKEKKCFIQVISDTFSHTFEFPFSSFYASKDNLLITIGDNKFSSEGITLNLVDDKYHINVNLVYNEIINIKSNIMGPFNYFPLMECKHNIFSMKHIVEGIISINNDNFKFTNDLGYIEGDLGKSFPKSYMWVQSNNFNAPASFFFSCATIPYLKIKFRGLIASLMLGDKEYRFATYNFSKIIKISDNYIKIKRGKYLLVIYIDNSNTHKLQAPRNGKMDRVVNETLNGLIKIELFKKDKLIFKGIGSNAGIEISN